MIDQIILASLATFNMVCHAGLVAGDRPRSPDSVEVTYRIDLGQGLWCTDACDRVRPLAGLSADEILLEQDFASFLGVGYEKRISRMSGRYLDDTVDFNTHVGGFPAADARYEGRCTFAPFAGFPSASLEGVTRLPVPPPREPFRPAATPR